MVVNPITVRNFSFLVNCMPVGWASDSMTVLTIDEMVGSDALAVVRLTRVYLLDFFCSGIQIYVLLSPYVC